jgi:uncharacterized protein YndB with AHSA1/START domain
MTEQTYTLQAAVGAPPATVYAALTSPAALQTWLAEHAEVALDDGVFEFWGRYMASYCEGRPVAPMCDFTASREKEARGYVEIDAPPDRVFAALIEPAELNRWIATNAAVEPRVGGRYDFGWDHGPVKILELEPGRTLAYSWRQAASATTGGPTATSSAGRSSGLAQADARGRRGLAARQASRAGCLTGGHGSG